MRRVIPLVETIKWPSEGDNEEKRDDRKRDNEREEERVGEGGEEREDWEYGGGVLNWGQMIC